MRCRRSENASVLLQFVVFLLIASSALVYLVAWKTSRRIGAGELEARIVMRAIAAAENESRAATGGYAPLLGLLDVTGTESAPDSARLALRRRLARAGVLDGVVIHGGYCFLIRLPDARGLETRVEQPGLDRDHYVAYAWPERHGVSGRRVFVVDPSGGLRAWENRLPGEFSYSGPEEAPPVQIAPLADGRDQPFALKRQGPQKTLVWVDLDEVDS